MVSLHLLDRLSSLPNLRCASFFFFVRKSIIDDKELQHLNFKNSLKSGHRLYTSVFNIKQCGLKGLL